MAEIHRIAAERLRSATTSLLRAAGSAEREARLVADHLVEANLRGHDSHGVGVLPLYISTARAGGLVLNQTLMVALDTGSLLICDAGNGAGQVMAHDAMALGIERARQSGSAIVSLRNSHHVGRIGHWAEQCASAGMVSLHFVNVAAGTFVAPFAGTRARLGTNPFAAGFPRPDAPPVIVDFATSQLAMGKIRVAHNKGEALPPGALLDAEGRPTTDPAALFATPPGSMVTFGDHKGWGLALACELLGAALVGGKTQSGPDGAGTTINSMFSVIVSPEQIGTAAAFSQELEAVLGWVLSENADGASIKLPGTPELETRALRLRDGIPLDPKTLDQIAAAARDVGLTAIDLP
ncbi:malate/lactate/ureidoglycolate dehydrogenase [Kaistia dalseonensis]|uniref:Oxidoreductase n=1 Tax=Kaistia dalseonensis TaxID=410840 RepID=A0ABU0H4S9_9HYPH|nr:malate/lactate/ureidoglycolate dehydrogenase [Kaistia dalseonensis]MCX5494738.1 malate/lactate/ureidoglycolate dehydrogenase [Kaistia dalseonensis]MDQ0437319.1 putative oxidoreductase [Kaistia dalseonensis]